MGVSCASWSAEQHPSDFGAAFSPVQHVGIPSPPFGALPGPGERHWDGAMNAGPTGHIWAAPSGREASGRQQDLLCTFQCPRGKCKLPACRIRSLGKEVELAGWGGAEGGRRDEGRGRCGRFSAFWASVLGVWGLHLLCPEGSVKARLQEFCLGSPFSRLPCLDPVTPARCHRSMGATPASLPARPGLASGPVELPSFAQGRHPGGQAHLHALRGLPHEGVCFQQDRAGWSPAVDLALNLFTAK